MCQIKNDEDLEAMQIVIQNYLIGEKSPLEETPIKHTGSDLSVETFVKNSDKSFRAVGYVYNDERFDDGEVIHTSRIESIDFVNRTLKTMNTLYNLV